MVEIRSAHADGPGGGVVDRARQGVRRLGDRVRGRAERYRDREARHAGELAAYLDAETGRSGGGPGGRGGSRTGGRAGGDDDEAGAEIVIRPWEFRLPRLVVLHAAEARGLVPVGGRAGLVERGPWLEPMRFTRPTGHLPGATSGAAPAPAGETTP